ncbi:MAG TPA: regulatory iron-sulfur-containing complex subunit RicT, partial [Chitinophagaceae bacterium]|nr:regulatory iron-sulfur-containing complex subunit RicT [Chitinophagaceae bacterium]
GSRKDYFRNSSLQQYEKGELITVEGVSGFDVGEISLTGEIVRLQLKKKEVDEFNPEMKRVLRRAGERDIEVWKQNKARERDALIRARAITKQLKLNMKLTEVEIQADGRKATFFYIADDRVDFRELIKIYASEFKVKVEMRQIGARQEAAKVGGIGSCGRELCCSTWLSDFKSVNTTAARYQNLSINQTKLSGQCGRLKCCLNYELDTYLDALQHFPDNADTIQVARGNALLVKKDIFKSLMWYILPDSNKQYPLTIERVRKIRALNAQGIIPEELGVAEVVSTKPQEVESGFVELVGHISLGSLEKNDRGRRKPQQQSRGGGEGRGGNDSRGGGQQRGNQSRGGGRPSGPGEQGGRPSGGQGAQGGGRREQGPREQGGAPREQGGGNREQRPPREQGGPREQGQNRGGNRGGGDRPSTGSGSQGNRPPGNRPPGGGSRGGDRGGNRPSTGSGQAPSTGSGQAPREQKGEQRPPRPPQENKQ